MPKHGELRFRLEAERLWPKLQPEHRQEALQLVVDDENVLAVKIDRFTIGHVRDAKIVGDAIEGCIEFDETKVEIWRLA